MLITIFTPTYNRKEQIKRLYNSLKNQSYKDFEWLIVDDGSTDDTSELVHDFVEEKAILIKYIKQSNGGKHTAYNTALNYAEGKYFFCIDSDDWIGDNFLEKLSKESKYKDCAGFIAYKCNSKNELLSKKFPRQVEECSLFNLSEKYHCEGEFSIIIRSNIAKKYKFPVFDNEKFIGENVVYDKLSEKYKFRLLAERATICEYQEDGLTDNYADLMKKNPSGFCLYYMQRIDLSCSFITKINMAGRYNCFRIFCNNKKLKYSGKNKMLVFYSKPLGWLFWIYYKVVRGF